MVNVLEGAQSPHFFEEKEPLLYIYSKYFTDLLQSIFTDLLTVELQWNFTNNSLWFLDSIQDFIEFISPLLDQLKDRAILPFVGSFGKVGTYEGFAQACIGLFGEQVIITYDDSNYAIDISNANSNIYRLIIGEGRADFVFVTEDGVNKFRTEDDFVPPSGISTLIAILRSFLPSEVSEITAITFSI